ncbi:hypothetical protein [Cypionkella sp.]|uniref:hypothetical protein n=1 Tax=Cypionkella sp. TaxID=2811411 RepID=UPI002AC9A36D|nr:hypothetical protein [Cypionkella sp.]
MALLVAGISGLLAYGFTSVFLYGGPLQALGLLTIWRDRLGLAFWPALVLVAMVLAIFPTKFSARFGMPRVLLPAVFVVISMGFSALLVGSYAANQRDGIVEKFEPDVEIRSSVFASFRNAPHEFQFFLHGAALKDCKPYAWSYRQMAFYELPPNVAVNVLPTSWIKKCNIQRTR